MAAVRSAKNRVIMQAEVTRREKLDYLMRLQDYSLEKWRQSPALALFGSRSFGLLWLAQMISTMGDWALYVALPVVVYNATHSKSALGISFICGTLPALLFSLLGGVLADRWPQKRTMIAADLARTGAILLLLLVSSTKHLGRHDLLLFYMVSFLVASFSCFFSPARQSLMRVIVPKADLMQANSLSFTGIQACSLLGPAVGGLLLALTNPKSVFVFDAATFAASAFLIGLIAVDKSLVPPPRKVPRGPKGVWQDANEGIAYVGNSLILRPALVMLLTAVTASQITNTLEFPFVRDLWHGGASQYAGLVSLGFSAALLTGLAASGPLRSVPPARLLLIGFSIMGVTTLVFAGSKEIFIGGAMLFVSGVGNTIENIGNMTLFQSAAPPELQGRVSATISLLVKIATSVGSLLMVGLTLRFHGPLALRLIFAGVALVYLFCGGLAWITLRRFTAQDIADAGAPPEPEPAAQIAEPVHA